MAISKITGAGLTTTDSITASQLAPDSVGHSELNDATGVTTTHHKVPSYADADARDAAISSPANGMIIYNTAASALQQYNGAWAAIVPAPAITSISGKLNEDNDSTLTIFGSNFNSSSVIKLFSASSGGSQVGSNATTTFNSVAKLTAVFGSGSLGNAGDTVYIEVDNSGIATRFQTAIILNADPVIALSGNTGTGADATDHLGTYGGALTEVDSTTKLLLNFDRGGGTDLEDSSNYSTHASSNEASEGQTLSAVGNTKIKASPFGDGKTAIKFDGSGDKLTVPASADFEFGTGAFTIEMWFQFIGGGELWQGMAQSRVFIESSQIKVVLADTNGFMNALSRTIATYKWYHLALVRANAGTIVSAYLDGVLWGTRSVSSSATCGNAGTAPKMGEGDAYFNGYMDDIRVCKGVAVYTGNFDVPKTRLATTQSAGTNISAITGTQCKLLIHSNLSSTSTSFTDSSSVGRTITVSADAKHSTLYNHAESTVVPSALPFATSGKRHGSTGAYFDGNGDRIQITDTGSTSDFNFGTSDFTIDFWAKANDLASRRVMIGRRDGGSDTGWYIAAKSTTELTFSAPNASATRTDYDFTFSLGTTAWHHIALVRSSAVMKFYVDGTQVGSNITTVHNFDTNNSVDLTQIQIGGALIGNSWNYFWNGYLDIIRISNTARWTANFTSPTTLYHGQAEDSTVPTITLTGTTTPALASDEDIEYTSIVNPTKPANNQHLTDSGIGLTLTNLTGGDKSKATLTGTIASDAGTTHTNMAIKAQVRKTLGDVTFSNASTTVTFGGSTKTTGLAPGMPVTGTGISIAGPLTCGLTNADATVTAASTTGLVVGMQVNAFTGVPAGATILSIITNTSFEISANATATDADAKLTFNTIISTVDSTTQITLSNNSTSAVSGGSLVFEDLTRITHINGPDVFDGSQAMMTVATGTLSGRTLFNLRRFRGSGATRDIDGLGFQPDFIWGKKRDSSTGGAHWGYDSIRGVTKTINMGDNAAEVNDNGGVLEFQQDGFTIAEHSAAAGQTNATGDAYIVWCWKAGGAPSGNNKRRTDDSPSETSLTTSSSQAKGANVYGNTAGTSNLSLVKQSVNSAGDFSITKWDSSNVGGNTHHVCHGLSGKPDCLLVKQYDDTTKWCMWHKNLPTQPGGYLELNEDVAQQTGDQWGGQEPDTTSVNFGNNSFTNYNGSYIMYAWKAVTGVSAFGTYEGDGGSNRTITTGFQPAFVMLKNCDATNRWIICDKARETSTTKGNIIYPNLGYAESDHASHTINFESTGFAFTTATTLGHMNANGNTFIYLAFA